MALSIRNPKIETQIRSIATRQGKSMTEVIGLAIADFDKKEKVDLLELAKRLNAELLASAPSGFVGRNLTKDEINAEWMN